MSTRVSSSPGELSDCVKVLEVLAHPTRLAVLKALMDGGPKHVNELQAMFDIEQSLLSHHLRVLRDAGLVGSVTDGKGRLYSAAEACSRGSIELGCCELTFGRSDKPDARTKGTRRRLVEPSDAPRSRRR